MYFKMVGRGGARAGACSHDDAAPGGGDGAAAGSGAAAAAAAPGPQFCALCCAQRSVWEVARKSDTVGSGAIVVKRTTWRGARAVEMAKAAYQRQVLYPRALQARGAAKTTPFEAAARLHFIHVEAGTGYQYKDSSGVPSARLYTVMEMSPLATMTPVAAQHKDAVEPLEEDALEVPVQGQFANLITYAPLTPAASEFVAKQVEAALAYLRAHRASAEVPTAWLRALLQQTATRAFLLDVVDTTTAAVPAPAPAPAAAAAAGGSGGGSGGTCGSVADCKDKVVYTFPMAHGSVRAESMLVWGFIDEPDGKTKKPIIKLGDLDVAPAVNLLLADALPSRPLRDDSELLGYFSPELREATEAMYVVRSRLDGRKLGEGEWRDTVRFLLCIATVSAAGPTPDSDLYAAGVSLRVLSTLRVLDANAGSGEAGGSMPRTSSSLPTPLEQRIARLTDGDPKKRAVAREAAPAPRGSPPASGASIPTNWDSASAALH